MEEDKNKQTTGRSVALAVIRGFVAGITRAVLEWLLG